MRLVQRSINPKVNDVVIGSGKTKRFSQNPWECKKQERMKWAKDAPKNEMSEGCPMNRMGWGSPRCYMD